MCFRLEGDGLSDHRQCAEEMADLVHWTVTSTAPRTGAPPTLSSSWPGLNLDVVADLEAMLKHQKDFDPTTRYRDDGHRARWAEPPCT